MKQKHFIDSHKGFTGLAALGIMYYYQSWENTTAWVYLALHGSYGIMWILKSIIFGDKQWESKTSIWYGLYIWIGLSLYWITPYLISSQKVQAPAWYLSICIALYSIGIFYHFASDMQKHIQLSITKGLIKTGLWANCRNPNYFGELLIYLGFSMLAMSWIPIAVIAIFMGIVWIPNMIKKDKSLSRYPDYADYKRNSKWIIPFII
jgi:protein-S-isoprenylcysteine O-methyltransferase Ste14